jgi:hypothetical protein
MKQDQQRALQQRVIDMRLERQKRETSRLQQSYSHLRKQESERDLAQMERTQLRGLAN